MAAGTTLKEGFEVQGENVSFDVADGLWTVTSAAVRTPTRGENLPNALDLRRAPLFGQLSRPLSSA